MIDASVMPHLVSGNTNAASVVIGDKGADLVLGLLPPAPKQWDVSGLMAATVLSSMGAAEVV